MTDDKLVHDGFSISDEKSKLNAIIGKYAMVRILKGKGSKARLFVEICGYVGSSTSDNFHIGTMDNLVRIDTNYDDFSVKFDGEYVVTITID